MKVLAQYKFEGKYKDDYGTDKKYEKMLLIVQNGDYDYPKMINLPADTPDLRGKDIEVLYGEYWNQGKKVYKAKGYNILNVKE